MKKPKPRHIKKEIAKQVREIQKRMGLSPRQLRATMRLAEAYEFKPQPFDSKMVLHLDTRLVGTAINLDPMNHCKTASRLSMRLPNLTSTTPLTSQEAYDVLWGGIDAELASGMGKTLPLGEGHFGVNTTSTPEERAERFRRSMPEGYNKQEDARGHEAYLRDSVRDLSDEALLNIIDRTSHPVVNRPNPLREHWERFGDQSDLRPVPDVNVDELLDKEANPELLKRIAGLLKFDPKEGKE